MIIEFYVKKMFSIEIALISSNLVVSILICMKFMDS